MMRIRHFFLTGIQVLFFLIATQVSALSQSAQNAQSTDGPWLRPKGPHGALIWGRRDGLIFGLPSPG
ncbi:MAG: hypothetical protein ACRD63_03450, partial [Pyrinomonadaceae bacterium]